ncbi:MAG TPA: FAD-binding monooxygenase, partial [Anaerolineae bacterium]|nr:FAD-binding monooxygenase [Anaerolineae bacterium]
MGGVRYQRAVVLGGGLAGMVAAKVLAGHFEEVVVVERDVYPEGDVARPGVPQSPQLHGLMVAGLRALEGIYPNFVAELEGAGVVMSDSVAETSL